MEEIPTAKKINRFLHSAPQRKYQVGARDRSPREELVYTDLPDADESTILPQENTSASTTPYGPSSTSNSPAKSRIRLAPEVRPELDDLLTQTPASSPIAAFPTTNHIDTMLKDMLISLHSSLHNDISSMFSAFKSEMVYMGNKVGHMEQQMSAMTETVNDLVDPHNHTCEEQWVQAKMADRSRHNNVKI